MAHLTVSVEYGLHCLLWLVGSPEAPVSSRDLADFQGISPSFVAKIFPKLEKAGIVRASEGVRGGYLLAKAPESISILDVVDAIEGQKPLFDCQEIRGRCAVFGNQPPKWATAGVCAIHAVMLGAEKAMRDSLASQSLADVGRVVGRKAPRDFSNEVRDWLDERTKSRSRKPAARDLSS
ncbi:Rrf2 family transcriptional regulator [Rhizobium mongolense]|uniref:RrF2 family transcriptional regulator n=1 Tax=Rhizobium TaxID=379 RepID=UPI000B72F1F2|nr:MULTISPECIES: Rrf2 family transcriptional regulator [unclassified Rhizobium]OWK22941.1 transcriptional regulator [Rhizobium yanglingense]QPB24154.1 Rrf2 family transcriptional regulator [Rhizobium sp. 007]WFU91234.1 Rrf2 family transcriptional regulator [Rhizobium sp. CC1099]